MKKTLLSLLAIILIFEEWLWDLLTAIGHTLARWLNLESFEQWLSQTSPITALVAFSIPLLIVTPINLLAFGLLFGDNYPVRFVLPHIIIKLLKSRHTSSVPDSIPIVPHIFNFTLLKRLCQRLGNFTKISITI